MKEFIKSQTSKAIDLLKNLHEDETGMLILSRKVNQGIWIEGDIWVKVLSVERDRVKLGISAPSEVKVMRQELFEAGEPPDARGPKPPGTR